MNRFLILPIAALGLLAFAGPAGAAPFLGVTPHNPVTDLSTQEMLFGQPVCQGTTKGAMFGYVSGSTAPYSVTMTFSPMPPFGPTGGAAAHDPVVTRSGAIEIRNPEVKWSGLDAAPGAKHKYSVVVTVTDSAGTHVQVTDVWKIVSDC